MVYVYNEYCYKAQMVFNELGCLVISVGSPAGQKLYGERESLYPHLSTRHMLIRKRSLAENPCPSSSPDNVLCIFEAREILLILHETVSLMQTSQPEADR